MSIQREEEQSRATQSDDVNIILPLATIDRTLLPISALRLRPMLWLRRRLALM